MRSIFLGVVRPGLVVLAIGLALAAQQLVNDRSSTTQGWLLFAVAAVLIALASWERRPAPVGSEWNGPSGRPRRLWWGIVAIAALSATTWFSVHDRQPVAVVALWLLSLACATVAVRGSVLTPPARMVPQWTRAEKLTLAAIVALGALARVIWLDSVPRFHFDDEARVGIYLRDAYRYGLPNVFTMGWNTWPVVGLSLQGIFAPLLGLNTTALRLASALAGTLAILATHLLARQLFSPRVGLLAAFLFACGRTALDFSRMGICHAQVFFFETLAFFFLWHAINTGRGPSYLWTGIGLGLCLFTYNAGQLAPLLWLGWLLVTAVVAPRMVRSHWRGPVTTLVGLVLTVLPFFVFATDQFTFAGNWREYTGMARSRQTMSRIVEAWNGVGSAGALPIVTEQVVNTWLGFTVLPANAYALGYRGGGMLDHVSGPLFVLGLAVCCAHLFNPPYAFVLYWWLVTAVVGGVLTQAPPAYVRMVGLLPAVAILAALPLDYLLRRLAAVPYGAVAARGAVALLLAGVVWDNWRTYFVAFPRDTRWPASELAHYLSATPPDTAALLVGSEHFVSLNTELFQLNFRGRVLENVAEPVELLPLRYEPSHPFALIFAPTQLTLAGYATALYPGTTAIEIPSPSERQPMFRIVQLSAAQVAQRQGLQLEAFGTDGARLASVVTDPFGDLPPLPAAPQRLEWRGSVFWPTDQPATLTVTAATRAQVTLAHHILPAASAADPVRVEVQLPRGWQPLQIEEQPGTPRGLTLAIENPRTARTLLARDLRPDGMDQGLLAVYQRDDKLLLRQVEPQLDAYAVEDLFFKPNDVPVRMPFRVRWTGALETVRPGRYEFEAIGSGPYRIQLGGETLFEQRPNLPEEPRSVTRSAMLPVGAHPLDVVWDSTKRAHTSRRIFQLYWTPPDGTRELIPPSSFRLPMVGGGHTEPFPTIGVQPTPTPIHLTTGSRVSLTELQPSAVEFGFAPPRMNQSIAGPRISLGGTEYAHGIGAHAWCRMTYAVPPGAAAFEAIVGLADGIKGCDKASVTFELRDQHDKVLYDSGVIDGTADPKLVRIPLQGVSTLTLAVTDAGDGIDCDHANWAEPSFVMAK